MGKALKDNLRLLLLIQQTLAQVFFSKIKTVIKKIRHFAELLACIISFNS